MKFELLSHHFSIFLLHQNGLYTFLGIIGVTDGDDVAQKIEVSSVDWSSKFLGFFLLQFGYFVLVCFNPEDLYPVILSGGKSTSEHVMMYLSD